MIFDQKKTPPYFGGAFRKYWAILDLNQGPKDYESSALTAELMARMLSKNIIKRRFRQYEDKKKIYPMISKL